MDYKVKYKKKFLNRENKFKLLNFNIKAITLYILILFLIFKPVFIFADNDNKEGKKNKNKINKDYIFNNLDQVIEFAINNNNEIKKLLLDLKKAQIDLQLAKAKKFPTIKLNVNLTYIGNPIGPVSISQGSLGTYPSANGNILIPPEDIQIYKGMENTIYQFTLQIDQPVFTWGKIDNSIKIYEKALDLAKLKIEEKENEIKTKLSIFYYSIFFMKQIIKNIETQKKYTGRILKIVNDSYENGFITKAELLKTKISVKEIELGAFELETNLKTLINSLKIQLGIDLSANVILNFEDVFFEKENFEFKKFSFEKPEKLYKIALKNNIQFKQLEFLKYINDLQVKINEASSYFKPDIGIRFELSYSGPRFPLLETGWYGNDDYNFTFSLAFVSLLFDKGQQKGKINQSKQELEKVLINFDLAKQNLYDQIEKFILNINLSLNKIDYYKIKISNDKININEKKIIFEGGSGNEIDYLKAKLDLESEWINLYKELINYYNNVFTLKAILNNI